MAQMEPSLGMACVLAVGVVIGGWGATATSASGQDDKNHKPVPDAEFVSNLDRQHPVSYAKPRVASRGSLVDGRFSAHPTNTRSLDALPSMAIKYAETVGKFQLDSQQRSEANESLRKLLVEHRKALLKVLARENELILARSRARPDAKEKPAVFYFVSWNGLHVLRTGDDPQLDRARVELTKVEARRKALLIGLKSR